MDNNIINLTDLINDAENENEDIESIVDEMVEDDMDEDDVDDEDDETIFTSKHKASGKHSLGYKTFVKEEKKIDEDDFEMNLLLETAEATETNRGSAYYIESIENDNYVKNKKVAEKIYNYLLENTDMNFLMPRRKTSIANFNNIFFKLINLLKGENCSKIVIFHELAYYYSDNLRNMFKMLDEQYKMLILAELETYLGKKTRSKEIDVRNIDVDSEIEFLIEDIMTGNIIKKTGIVMNINKIEKDCIYSVDTYDDVYDVSIKNVTKIIENIKHKRNFSKIKNIDFI